MPQEDYTRLVERLKIKLRELDRCCAEQPGLLEEVSAEASQSMAHAVSLKLKRDRVRAEVDLEVRRDPDKYDLAKATDKAIVNVVACDQRVQAAEDEYEAANVSAKQWDGLLNAYEHRRSMLNNEVKLWSGDYFSAVDTSGGRAGRKEKLRDEKNRRRDGNGDDN